MVPGAGGFILPESWDNIRDKQQDGGTCNLRATRGKILALTCPVPLLLSWYTLKRGKQMLWVMPAPATAVAP